MGLTRLREPIFCQLETMKGGMRRPRHEPFCFPPMTRSNTLLLPDADHRRRGGRGSANRVVRDRGLFKQAGPLKERTLGIEIFGREAEYDTASDPIVRSRAGSCRLKSQLPLVPPLKKCRGVAYRLFKGQPGSANVTTTGRGNSHSSGREPAAQHTRQHRSAERQRCSNPAARRCRR